MKQKIFIYILLFLVFSSSKLFGQSYWAPIGAKWYYDKLEGTTPPNRGYVLIEAVKDTLLNGKRAIELQKTYFSSYGDTSDWGQSFTYFVNDTVYFWDGDTFQCLYVFSANEGDSWPVFSNEFNPCGEDSLGIIKVDSIKTENINNIELKYTYTSPDDTSIWDLGLLIENIGSTKYMFPVSKDCGYVDFIDIAGPLRCYCDTLINTMNLSNIPCDTLINEFTSINRIEFNGIKIFPNPTKNKIKIETTYFIITKIQLYNSLGQLIYTKLLNSQSCYFELNYPPGPYYLVLIDNNGNKYSSTIIVSQL